MSASRFEAFLAGIYIDEKKRTAFLADRRGQALKAGLTVAEAEALAGIDVIGLEMLAASLKRKRQRRKPVDFVAYWRARLFARK